MAKKFIQAAHLKKGALHKELGIPQEQKIPEATLKAAAKKPGKLGKRARFAETLKGFKKEPTMAKLKDLRKEKYGK